jgi:hypothetical protein
MEKSRFYAIGGLLCCFIALMSGCASSELFDVWSNSSFQSPPLNKILVISVVKNPMYRHVWEDAFIAGFAKRNVAATSSYTLFPDALPDTNQVLQIMRLKGFDGVFISRWIPSETKTHYMREFGAGEHNLTNEFDQRFVATYFRDFNYAGNVDSQKVDIRVFDLWETKGEGQIIWRAMSQSPQPNSALKVRPEIVKLVMSKLTEQGIIAPER